MTTTVAPNLKPERPERDQRPTIVRPRPDPAPQEPDTRSFDGPAKERQIGSDPFEDPTQGRKIGSDPFEDPTQGRKIGSDPYDDPTRGR